MKSRLKNGDQNNLVSLIVPFYNEEAYLKEAIESVLNQSYQNWELLLVNDGSAKRSESIAKKYADNKKIFLFNHPGKVNKGVSLSRALAIEKAKGDYISFLDADDFYKETRIEKQVGIMEQLPEVILVHTPASFISSSKKEKTFFNEFKFDMINQPYSFLDNEFLKTNPICNSSVMVRTEFMKKINQPFRHLFQYEDWINWILLAEQGKFYYLNEPLCNYRFHDASSTAHLLENPLRSSYAKLEMLLILLQRVVNKDTQDKIGTELSKQFQILYSSYDPKIENGESFNQKTTESLRKKPDWLSKIKEVLK